jgi:hypothetical protein
MNKQNKRLPRKQKKQMKKKYQSIDSKFKITGSLYDGFLGLNRQAKYYGKIHNWKDLINCV